MLDSPENAAGFDIAGCHSAFDYQLDTQLSRATTIESGAIDGKVCSATAGVQPTV